MVERNFKLGHFGEKAERFAFRHPALDRRINILEGAVRSSKTWAMLPKLLWLSRYPVAGHRIILGVTKNTVYNNVLDDLFSIVGPGAYRYSRSTGVLSLFGTKWQIIGARDEGSEKYIRGLTIGVAYCDELSLIPRSSYQMIMSRMSPKGARFYATTNPDSPYHWLKTEVIDSVQLHEANELFVEHFSLDDNPHLDQDFKESLKRQFSGLFYKRFIEGLWVLAEGAIYRDVLTEDIFYTDAERPIGLRSRGGHYEHWISVDYGTINPCVFVDAYDDGNTVWVDRELYWDSRTENRQKTDAEYANDMVCFVGGGDSRTWPGVIVDPSAASLRTELRNRGLWVIDADNSVDDGIRRVSAMLNRKKLRINKQGCPNGVKEMQSYAWADKKAEVTGKEQPLKSHDHFPDAVRYIVQTRIGDWRLVS
jgi:PBSX family phage terminase large subunit